MRSQAFFRDFSLLLRLGVLLSSLGCTHEQASCAQDWGAPGCDPWICCQVPTHVGCDPVEVAVRCPHDAGSVADADSGVATPDAGPCGMPCSAERPICDAVRGECVQCTEDDDEACDGQTPLCDVEAKECVACLEHTDCTDPAAARCIEGACAPCTEPEHCAGVPDAEVCDVERGLCVECLSSADCGGSDTCDLLSHVCVSTPTRSLRTCEACTNDEQCPGNHRCVRMEYMGVPRDPGYYCLLEVDAPGDCPPPFVVGTPPRPSLNGIAAETYCGIAESITSCEAARALLDDWRCEAGVDGRCWSPAEPTRVVDIPGARCEDLGGGVLTNRCTYSCAGGLNRCPDTITCGDGGTGEANYCGG